MASVSLLTSSSSSAARSNARPASASGGKVSRIGHISNLSEGLTLSLLLQCDGSLLVQLERFFLVVVLGVVATQLLAPVPE